MISAFGVEHTIAKGFPLKPTKVVSEKGDYKAAQAKIKRMKRGTTPREWYRGDGKGKPDVTIDQREGTFFQKPKRVIGHQRDSHWEFAQYGGGMTGRGKATLAIAGTGAAGGGVYAAKREKR